MKKETNCKIGFDFDKVFVSYPPFVPGFLIDWLYKHHGFLLGGHHISLSYRFPGKLEQKIRIFSHSPFFRPPIWKNITSLHTISKNSSCEMYLISSRFSFLKGRTDQWMKKNGIDKYFKEMYFNYDDKQPHEFKNEIIKKLNLQKFVDDDLDLLRFLAKKNPNIKFYWITPSKKTFSLPNNIKQILKLSEFE